MAGIRLVRAAGQQWRIQPEVGDLTSVESGMSTTLGSFSVEVAADGAGGITGLSFVTPEGTTGDVILPKGTTGTLTSSSGETVTLSGGVAAGISGGNWTLVS